MTLHIDMRALAAARARLDRAHADLVRIIDLLPGLEGETRMVTAEIGAALDNLKIARQELDALELRA